MTHTDRSRTIVVVATLLALIVVVVAVGASHASAAGDAADPRTALRRFEFHYSTEVTGGGAAGTSSFGVESSGAYVAPGNQDCRVTGKLGDLEFSQRAVLIDGELSLGTGRDLDAARRRDWEFANVCPSDEAFWSDLAVPVHSIGILPGKASTRDGLKVRHHDLSALLGDVMETEAFRELVPAGYAIDRMDLWVARRGGWIAALEMRTSGSTDETCREMTGGALDDITAPCTLAMSLQVTRANDPGVRVAR